MPRYDRECLSTCEESRRMLQHACLHTERAMGANVSVQGDKDRDSWDRWWIDPNISSTQSMNDLQVISLETEIFQTFVPTFDTFRCLLIPPWFWNWQCTLDLCVWLRGLFSTVTYLLQVVIDPSNGMTKGYGFVKFGDEDEKDRAMREMNGTFISTRQVRSCESCNE